MTAQERQSLRNWEEFHKAFSSDMPVDSSLSRQDIDSRRVGLEKDPMEWIRYFFPSYAKYDFAPFHIKAIHRLTENDEWYEVLSWSRELAKSTTAMFALMYLALTGRVFKIQKKSRTIFDQINAVTH